MDPRESVLITGVSGNLGTRLLPLLTHRRRVVGVDIVPPASGASFSSFANLDLGEEDSCQELIQLMHETKATAVVHLAFVLESRRTGVLDLDRMWRVNVAGTARVMEAITEVNRRGGNVKQFIFSSSVAAYGPETPGPVTESHPLSAHTLPYAVHKKQADEVVRYRADTLGKCSVWVLRPHIFTGAVMQNYFIGAIRGVPTGQSPRADRWRKQGKRIPYMVPYGNSYPEKKLQFIHVDDMARLLAWLLDYEEAAPATHVLNVAATGEPLTLRECAEIAHNRIMRVPGRWACRAALERLWNSGVSAIPPEALPYLLGSYTMDTTRLRKLLGPEYPHIIRHNVANALAESFNVPSEEEPDLKTG